MTAGRAPTTGPPTGPSAFVRRAVRRVKAALDGEPAALDLAMGSGRHSRLLAASGFRLFGVDRDFERVRLARAALARERLSGRLWVADLEAPGGFPSGPFDLLLCVRYLQRAAWPALLSAVGPGGFVIYETFTHHQRRYDWGPRSPAHLLEPDELRRVFAAWDVWEHEEVDAPAAEARLLARSPLKMRLV